jgi:hypothetical protein
MKAATDLSSRSRRSSAETGDGSRGGSLVTQPLRRLRVVLCKWTEVSLFEVISMLSFCFLRMSTAHWNISFELKMHMGRPSNVLDAWLVLMSVTWWTNDSHSDPRMSIERFCAIRWSMSPKKLCHRWVDHVDGHGAGERIVKRVHNNK